MAGSGSRGPKAGDGSGASGGPEGSRGTSGSKGPRGARATRGGRKALGASAYPDRRQSDNLNPWQRAAQKLDKAREPRVEAEPATRKRSDGKLAAGRLGSPHGVHGDISIHSYSGETGHLAAIEDAELVRESEDLPATRLRLRVLRAEEGPGGLTLAFAGYESRERAALLSGMEILVDRGQAAPLGPAEWYVADLVGLELVAPTQAPAGVARDTAKIGEEAVAVTVYGRVRAVCGGGPDPWLEIELAKPAVSPADVSAKDPAKVPAEGSVKGPSVGTVDTVLVPFRKEFIGDIDLADGRVVLLAPWILE
jgi:16S rRNA processing protein RimM